MGGVTMKKLIIPIFMMLMLVCNVLAIEPIISVIGIEKSDDAGKFPESVSSFESRAVIMDDNSRSFFLGRADEICSGGQCATCAPYPRSQIIRGLSTIQYSLSSGVFGQVIQIFEAPLADNNDPNPNDPNADVVGFTFVKEVRLSPDKTSQIVTLDSSKRYNIDTYDCIQAEAICIEDDKSAGPTYPVEGTVSGKDIFGDSFLERDRCVDSERLHEFWCVGNGPNSEIKDCKDFGSNYICSNGRCEVKSAPEPIPEPDKFWCYQTADRSQTCVEKDSSFIQGFRCLQSFSACESERKEAQEQTVPAGSVEVTLKSHGLFVGPNKETVYASTFSIKNNYNKRVKGIVSMELLDVNRQANIITVSPGECGREEDVQATYVLDAGGSATASLVSNPPAGKYVDVQFYAVPNCIGDRPLSWGDVSNKAFDYEKLRAVDFEDKRYSESDLVNVVFKRDVNPACSSCPFTSTNLITTDEFTNTCRSGYTNDKDSLCTDDNKARLECVCDSATRKCEMKQFACPITKPTCQEFESTVAPKSACVSQEEEDFVCARTTKTVGENAAIISDSEAVRDIAWTTGVFSKLSTLFGPVTKLACVVYAPICESKEELLGAIVADEVVEFFTYVTEIKQTSELMKKINRNGYAWMNVEEFNFLNQNGGWEIVEKTEKECNAERQTTQNEIDKIIEDYEKQQEEEGEKEGGVEVRNKARTVEPIEPDKLKKITTAEKLKHMCKESSDCKGLESTCYSLSEIEERGWLSQQDVDSLTGELRSSFEEVIKKSGEVIGSSITTGTAVTVCGAAAIAGGITWPALPLCGGVGFITNRLGSFLEGVVEEDTSAIGICIDESEVGVQGFINNLKSSIAKGLGVSTNDPLVNYVLIGLAIVLGLIFMLLLRGPRRN